MLKIDDLKIEEGILMGQLEAVRALIRMYQNRNNYESHVIKTRNLARSTAAVPYTPRQAGSVGTTRYVVLCLGKHPGGLTASQIVDKFAEAKLFPKLDRRTVMARVASVLANKLTQGSIARDAEGVITLTAKGKEEYKYHSAKS